jgi:NAD+ kinase
MKIAFAASLSGPAQEALKALTGRYGQCDIKNADVVVALGGDGKVLKTLYGVLELDKPVYAMRRTGSVGFLCNDYHAENLSERLAVAQKWYCIRYVWMCEPSTARLKARLQSTRFP